MHPPSLVPLILIAVACGAAAGEATVRVDCRAAGSGPCIAPPAPPAPPTPPTPPAPPDLADAMPAVPPAPAAPPAIPAPPAPPPLPAVPEKAHAACAAKASGSKLRLTLGPGETMSGVCERVGGKMVFQLRSYRLND